MQNYRVTFGGEDIEYKTNFHDCRQYYPWISLIRETLKEYGIDKSWWFFEPHVEITWLCDDTEVAEAAIHEVCQLLSRANIEHNTLTPDDGQFGDWHGLTPEEREFGANRYVELANVAACYYDNMDTIEAGMGLEKHYMRTSHVLANQLGLDYEREGITLLKRGFLATLMFHLGNEKAVAIYEDMFKEKYLGKDENSG